MTSNLLEVEGFNIDHGHVANLIQLFYDGGCYNAYEHNMKHHVVQRTVERLWKVDYQCLMIKNAGELCENYPDTLIFPTHCRENSFKEPDIELPEPPTKWHNDLCPRNFQAVEKENYKLRDNNKEEEECERDADLKEYYSDSPKKDPYTKEDMRSLFYDSMYGRSRKRFVIPIILYDEKYIARSSTVPLVKEIVFRQTHDLAKDVFKDSWSFSDIANYVRTTFSDETLMEQISKGVKNIAASVVNIDVQALGKAITNFDHKTITERLTSAKSAIQADIKLIKSLKIKAVFDLMVEYGKVKYGFQCSSSEKAEEDNWYKDFDLNAIPYPGCEFFKEFESCSDPQDLEFDWSHKSIDAKLNIESDELKNIQSNLKEYKNWGLVRLTAVYLVMMLHHAKNAEDGLLVHCISGWDRTPLFVSLLRISLWADGVIHKSLNAIQMLYLTIAYDWMFFGHNLKDRNSKKEEIMIFCFVMLKFIACDHYNVTSENFAKIYDYKAETKTPRSSLGGNTSSGFEKLEIPNSGGGSQSVSPNQSTDSFQMVDTVVDTSLSLESCDGCLKNNENVKTTNRYRRLKELRNAFNTCYNELKGDKKMTKLGTMFTVKSTNAK